jgi:hypothetical protein
MSEELELAELLAKTPTQDQGNRAVPRTAGESPAPPRPATATDVDFAQWQIGPNGKFRPGAKTRERLPSGIYRLGVDDYGPYVELISIASDDIIELPEPAHVRVLSGIRKFWSSRDRYERHGLLYKRGVLLWGPPGGGKTTTTQLLMTEIVKAHNGIVLIAHDPNFTVTALRFLRRIEPLRPLIVVFEDVDEIVSNFGEHALLAVLDGEHQTDNVVYVACPAPEVRILKADLTWVRADTLKAGDELIAFDEEGPQRKYRTSVVNSCPIISKPRYRVTTEQGSLIVSVGHPFLVKRSTGRWHEWKVVESLKKGDKLASVGDTWETDESRDGGYLAGQYDAEGSLNFSTNQHGSLSFRVCWGQVIGALSEKVSDLLRARGYKIAAFNKKPVMGRIGKGVGKLGPHQPQISFTVNGGKWENLRLLGSLRPSRLLGDKRLRTAWEGNRLCPKYTNVLSVEYLGEGEVVALDTTTKTFIGEGLLQHNTTNYPERLGARIVNRPSRFDERIKIGMPSPEARFVYLRKAVGESDVPLEKWVNDTENLSIAHLRELVVAILCLEQDYDTVLARLKAMEIMPKPEDGFKRKQYDMQQAQARVASTWTFTPQTGGGNGL